jgi:hypothetical protein
MTAAFIRMAMTEESVFAFDQAPFARRLAETVAWCRLRGNPEDPRRSLRSEELRPWLLAPDRGEIVFSVVRNRALYLFSNPPDRFDAFDELERGKLLVYFPDVNLCCGAAQDESRGFFDVENTPPWDTWVALGVDRNAGKASPYRTYLVSWVPSMMIQIAEAGIQANPERCLRWLTDAEVGAKSEVPDDLRVTHPLFESREEL